MFACHRFESQEPVSDYTPFRLVAVIDNSVQFLLSKSTNMPTSQSIAHRAPYIDERIENTSYQNYKATEGNNG